MVSLTPAFAQAAYNLLFEHIEAEARETGIERGQANEVVGQDEGLGWYWRIRDQAERRRYSYAVEGGEELR
jgi:DNA-binding MarR family transcriptional regulator